MVSAIGRTDQNAVARRLATYEVRLARRGGSEAEKNTRTAKGDEASSFIHGIYPRVSAMEVGMKTARMTTQGRFTIPAEIRRKYGIKPGDRVSIEQVGNVIKVRPVKKNSK